MFSPFRSLRSLSKPGMYLFFSFWQIAVTFGSGSVSFFLLFTICGHFRIRECICFSSFLDLRSLLEAGSVSYFLLFAFYGHFGKPEMYLTFSFSQFAVTFESWKCILFSPFRNLQSLWCPKTALESLPNKKKQQKTIFSPETAVFRQSKKDSGISCLFWRRYFFLWGVAKTI